MINKHIIRIEKKLENFEWLFLEQNFEIDKLSDEMFIIQGRFVFLDYTILEFKELMSENDHNYRFQYMDSNKDLIKRWDNAPHHPHISSHPFHLHEKSNILPS